MMFFIGWEVEFRSFANEYKKTCYLANDYHKFWEDYQVSI